MIGVHFVSKSLLTVGRRVFTTTVSQPGSGSKIPRAAEAITKNCNYLVAMTNIKSLGLL
jgi:hypothetical protein